MKVLLKGVSRSQRRDEDKDVKECNCRRTTEGKDCDGWRRRKGNAKDEARREKEEDEK